MIFQKTTGNYQMYIDGKWENSESENKPNVINPFNGTIIFNVPEGTREDAKKAIDSARDAFD
ncbi:hypothetical protein YTPLAS73_09790 [Nitrosarchaeum sp.]|nr:hypothetical protein YTPLAS73_09790 [Nitrosarchaeum sp.]